MFMVVLLACGDPAAEAEVVALKQQVGELQGQVIELQQQLEQQDQDREARRQELMERMERRRQERQGFADEDAEPSEGPNTLRDAMADPESASRMGRFLLHRGEDGAFDGYRLSAIRRGTLLDRLGLKNGDVVHRVSGHRLDSMTAAMQAFNELKDATELQVELTRNGDPLTLSVPVDAAPAAPAAP